MTGLMEAEYVQLKDRWRRGERDREHALHLLFLVWMHWADPPFVTLMEDDPDAIGLWSEIFDHFGGEKSQDAEFLHVAAVMSDLFPWALGSEKLWSDRADHMKARSLHLKPDGFLPDHFSGRSAYGDYFENHTRHISPSHNVPRPRSWWARFFRSSE